jgi:hypothetical protein
MASIRARRFGVVVSAWWHDPLYQSHRVHLSFVLPNHIGIMSYSTTLLRIVATCPGRSKWHAPRFIGQLMFRVRVTALSLGFFHKTRHSNIMT